MEADRVAPLNVTLVIAHLGLGGAERVLSMMANYWAAHGWRVTLVTLNQAVSPRRQHLDPAVAWTDLDFPGIRAASPRGLRNVRCLAALRRAINRSSPDAVISFLTATNVHTLISTIASRTPVIVAERSDPAHEPITPKWERWRRLLYPRASAVVVQTSSARKYFGDQVRVRPHVVPNPVVRLGTANHRNDNSIRTLVSVGRLSPEKRYDRLIAAFAELSSKHANWRLEIWGEGAERDVLNKQIHALGVSDRASLCGYSPDIGAVMGRANLFVLCSEYEGFPNALCEALACGVPAISVDCPSGPADILRNGIDGILVRQNDQRGLVEAMDRLMSDDQLRNDLGANAPAILERFSLDSTMTLWEKLIEQVR